MRASRGGVLASARMIQVLIARTSMGFVKRCSISTRNTIATLSVLFLQQYPRLLLAPKIDPRQASRVLCCAVLVARQPRQVRNCSERCAVRQIKPPGATTNLAADRVRFGLSSRVTPPIPLVSPVSLYTWWDSWCRRYTYVCQQSSFDVAVLSFDSSKFPSIRLNIGSVLAQSGWAGGERLSAGAQ